MVFPVCMTRNMGRFISERVEGRKGGRGITENPCFPQEGQCWGTTCLGQENWQGTERVLRERAEEVAGGRGCKKQPGLTRGFLCYRDKEEWKKVFSKQLLWNEFAGSVLNLKWSNMLWMGSFHQNVTQQEAGKNPKSLTSFGIRPALSALPGVTWPFPGLVTFELLPKALEHTVPAMQWDAHFSLKEVNFWLLQWKRHN